MEAGGQALCRVILSQKVKSKGFNFGEESLLQFGEGTTD